MINLEDSNIRLKSPYSHFLAFTMKVRQFVSARKANFFSGLALAAAGISSIIYSIRPTLGFDQIYYYWSFTYVKPYKLPQGTGYSIPVMVHTYEILVPWLIIGTVALLLGLFLIIRDHKRHPGKYEK